MHGCHISRRDACGDRVDASPSALPGVVRGMRCAAVALHCLTADYGFQWLW